jgi:hypothetical protein
MPTSLRGDGDKVPIREVDCRTIATRLGWLIRDTWAVEKKDDLFTFLAELSHNAVTQEEWFSVVMSWATECSAPGWIEKGREPSATMISIVCRHRPEFSQWVLCGGLLPAIV